MQESNPQEGPQSGYVISAQLPARMYGILRNVDTNAGKALGQAAVDAVNFGNEREIRVLGELLVRRLTNG